MDILNLVVTLLGILEKAEKFKKEYSTLSATQRQKALGVMADAVLDIIISITKDDNDESKELPTI